MTVGVDTGRAGHTVCPRGRCACGDRGDNRPDNLTIMSKYEHDQLHRKLEARTAGGRRKLTLEQVDEIRSRYSKGLARKLAREFGVSDVTIFNIVAGRTHTEKST